MNNVQWTGIERGYITNRAIGFVPRWRLLVYGVRPAALAGREAYTTKSGEKFYWIEDLTRKYTNGCEFILGDLNGAWERCGAPLFELRYCKLHYQACHKRLMSTEDLLTLLLENIPLKSQGV